MNDHLTPLLVGNAILIALGGLLAYAVTGHALSPVRRITATAAGINESDLNRRIDHEGPLDEVGRLAQTFDAMLGRLQRGFAQRQAFYALASHELRTPLTIVRGHLEVLRRTERPTPADIRETLDISLEELDRITDEINDMLLLGRMLLGQAGPLAMVDAAAVMTDVHRKAWRLAVRDWELDVPGPTPVRADAEQLSRALLNLVTNAVRHTRDGDRVRLACRADDGQVLLEVADAGDGIRAADLPHVFDPWYRAGKRDGRVGGLGLMIVHEAATAHGGRVDVVSREGQGATFTIRLPLASADPRPAAEPARSGGSCPPRRPTRPDGRRGAHRSPLGAFRIAMRCYDACVRTTLNMDDDVLDAARAIARTEGRPLGVVVSDLVRRGLVPEHHRIDTDDGFPVFRVRPGTAPMTDEMVHRALEEA